MSSAAQRIPHDRVRWGFFLLLAASVLLVLYVDERFLINPRDAEWTHIAPFKWLLLVHGLCGATALCTGPFQFSDTLRRNHITLHRWLGRTYVGAIFIAAPMAWYIGTHFEQPLLAAEQPAQAGGWLLCTIMALICVLRGNIPAHKTWMMKSYCFCMVFVASRVPDAFNVQWTDAVLSTFLWYLLFAALVGPDIVLTARDLWRKRRRA
ncbi:MAG: DUF2306 domain-containing protein [Alphaproteobacteria bacterium]|nr:DUF2306 domain-containing protein [Alphaproteobacteria bacterium]MDE2267110.1 DUF2306 domain-containing protein [Alphaproteobacteria bacterium]